MGTSVILKTVLVESKPAGVNITLSEGQIVVLRVSLWYQERNVDDDPFSTITLTDREETLEVAYQLRDDKLVLMK